MQAVAPTPKSVAGAVLNRIALSHSMVDPAMREDMAMQTSIVPGQADAGEDYLARVQRIAATIEAEAEASERGLRLTPTLQAALHREGLFRLLLPRPFGGFEIDPPTFFQVI